MSKDYRELTELRNWEKNPRSIKKDKFEELKKRITKRGQIKPLIITPDGEVLGGNMRLRAMQELGIKEAWVSVVEPTSEADKIEIALTDNEEMGYYEDQALAELIAKYKDEIDLSKYSVHLGQAQTLEEILKQFSPDEVVEDEVPEVADEAVSKLGEVYQLGRHRVMCGDSTKIEDVEKLMDGKKADMVFTDPPYGMKKENEGVLNDNLNYDDLLDFNKEWIPLSFSHLKENGSWYCWGIDEPLMDIYSEIIKPYIKENKATFRNLITWNKSYLKNGGTFNPFGASGMDGNRSYPIADEKCLFIMMGVQGFNNNSDNYYEAWEPIRLYLEKEMEKCGGRSKWKEALGNQMGSHYFTKSQWILPTEENYKKLQDFANGSAFKKEYSEIKKEYSEIKKEYYNTRAYFSNEDSSNNVWNIELLKGGEEKDSAGGHATPKPIELCSRAIKTSSRENELCLDLFLGSGSTLIACEQTNRICYGMELDPKYVDVIRKRYAKFIDFENWEINWQSMTPETGNKQE